MAAAVCLLFACTTMGFGQEVSVDAEQFKKLDTFEGTALSKADKVFGQKEYRQAAAEYDTFVLDFPKSPALAYAVFAILFNPLSQVALPAQAWIGINIAGAILLLVSRRQIAG